MEIPIEKIILHKVSIGWDITQNISTPRINHIPMIINNTTDKKASKISINVPIGNIQIEDSLIIMQIEDNTFSINEIFPIGDKYWYQCGEVFEDSIILNKIQQSREISYVAPGVKINSVFTLGRNQGAIKGIFPLNDHLEIL